jgi:NADH-quinone oxidoreductase subunit E
VNAKIKLNASAQLAHDIGDSVKRIDGTEVPLLTPWIDKAANSGAKPPKPAARPKPANAQKAAVKPAATKAKSTAKPKASDDAGKKPRTMKAPRKAGADDLKLIKGVGPKLEKLLNEMGFFHYDQIAKWGPAELAWVDANLAGFIGRASRDNWIDQAKSLAS